MDKLTISACNFLIPEITYVIKSGFYPEVDLVSFPVNCSFNTLNSKVIAGISKKSDSDSDVIVLGSFCHSPEKSDIKNIKNLQVIQLEQCFELILNPETIYHYIKNGYYLVTNGWLRTFESTILEWGFDKESALSYFQESMKSILFLDTQIPGDYKPNLLALSEYMGLPYEVLPVGLSHCKKYIDSVIFKWRNENEQRKLSEKLAIINKQAADYKLIFNQLETLVQHTNEEEIIQICFNLLNILFAPTEIEYKIVKGSKEELLVFQGFFFTEKIDDQNSFSVDIHYTGQLLGSMCVKGVQFPVFLKKYKEMGVVISQIFGMAIANARKYSELEFTNKALEKNKAELSELNATKDKFFSIIAHDLKSPFNSILGLSNILIDQIRNKDYYEIERYADIIHNSSKRAINLLMNLMEWSQSQTGRIEFSPIKFDLTKFIYDNTLLFDEIANQKNIKIKRKILSRARVFADKDMISTILRNLISNAIKFTKTGGEISIIVKEKKDKYLISIKDNGIGIPKEGIDDLFKIDKSYSTPGTANEAGTGLGLILCNEFINKHNEEIWIDSKEGEGTTISFSLKRSI